MREKDAQTDANTQIPEAIGSGPFIFAKDEWVPGSKVIYKTNVAYNARREPTYTYAGSKAPKVDRVELTCIPDPERWRVGLPKAESRTPGPMTASASRACPVA